MLDPNGQSIASPYCYYNGPLPITLQITKSGNYSVIVGLGGATLQLSQILPAPPGAQGISLGGSAITVNADQSNIWLTFSGTAGQRISMATSGSTLSSCSVGILSPAGSQVSASTDCSINTGGSSYVNPVSLPTTGTYTVFVNTSLTSGTLTLQLYNVPSDATATTSIGGSPVTLTTSSPGQAANVTFSAMAGQTATVQFSANTMSAVSVTLLGIDGSRLSSISATGPFFSLPSTSLPFTGVYEVQIIPNRADIGSITVTISTP